MEPEEQNLDERTRAILSGALARRLTPDQVKRFRERVTAKRQLGGDVPQLRSGEQLSRPAIMSRLAASPTWRIKDVADTAVESLAGTRKGFTVRMMRHPDGVIVHLHFVHIVDELYRLARWDADDSHGLHHQT